MNKATNNAKNIPVANIAIVVVSMAITTLKLAPLVSVVVIVSILYESWNY